jgi:hypothetical protein
MQLIQLNRSQARDFMLELAFGLWAIYIAINHSLDSHSVISKTMESTRANMECARKPKPQNRASGTIAQIPETKGNMNALTRAPVIEIVFAKYHPGDNIFCTGR